MRCVTRHTDYQSRTDVFRLIPITDWHLGNMHSNEKYMRELVKEIEGDPFTYWIGLGDYAEYITHRDPRFDAGELADWLLTREAMVDMGKAETRRFLNMVEPIKDKCRALAEGNHEQALSAHGDSDVYSNIVEALKGKSAHKLDHRGFVTWRFSRQGANSWPLRIFATHGSGGGSSKGNAGNKMGKLAEQVDGLDLLLMGHLHDPDYKPMAKMRVGPRDSRNVTIHCVSCPALCGDMQYANNKDLPALPTGHVEIFVTPNSHQIDVKMSV